MRRNIIFERFTFLRLNMSRYRSPNSRQARSVAHARAQIALQRMHRSNKILKSQALAKSIRQIDARTAQMMRNPRRASQPENMARYENRENKEFLNNVADLLDEQTQKLQKLRDKSPSINLNNSNTKLMEKNLSAVIAGRAEMVHGMLVDVDGNTIFFDQSNYPYIIVADFEALRNYKVYVDLFVARITDNNRLSHCTFENPDGTIEVILTRIAPSLTPGGSIVEM